MAELSSYFTSERIGKGDRTARLVKVEHLLYQNESGLTPAELARLCGVSSRTVYRDLQALQLEMGVPIWQEGKRWGIAEGYFLPPIHFTLAEALNVFLAARLMVSYAHRYDPNIASTFVKLNSVVPSPLKDQIQRTISWMQQMPMDKKHLSILGTVAESWVSQRQLKILYQALPRKQPIERVIEPYFIEPAAPGHSSYVVAFCHYRKGIRTFKIDRIESAQIVLQGYDIPSDFDANDFFGSSWGVVVEGEVKTVKLKVVAPEIIRVMQETKWHPSQVLEKQKDGSMIMTLQVTDTYELLSWILGWGEKMEVLEPPELRQDVIRTAKAMLGAYKG